MLLIVLFFIGLGLRTEYPVSNQYGQPGIKPRGGGPVKFMQRVTTLVKLVGNGGDGLANWIAGRVAAGAAMRPDLVEQLAAYWPPTDANKDKIKVITDALAEASAASEGRNRGDGWHETLRRVNLGHEFTPLTEDLAQCVKEYRELLERAGLEVDPRYVERTCVLPDIGVAGSFDFLARKRGQDALIVCDLKGLELATPLPTPSGWTTVAEVQVGDEVFDQHGKPCAVTGKSEVRYVDCYRIVFDDGSAVIADADHRWPVAAGPMGCRKEAVWTTREILRYRQAPASSAHIVRIPVMPGLQLPEADLLIDPYVLGAWLGDGSRRSGQICKPADHPLWVELERLRTVLPVQHSSENRCAIRTVQGLHAEIRVLGVANHKHIPATYMRSSYRQRLALLQGLMDTDGCWNKPRKRAAWSSVDKALALQVRELVASLGFRPYMAEINGFGFGKPVTSYMVSFTPTVANPFRARADIVPEVGELKYGKSLRRSVRRIESIPTVPTQCISVDSPDHTYLCTESMIPTHNTGKRYAPKEAAQLGCYANADSLYCWETEEHEDMPPVNRRIGLIVHMPTDGKASLQVVNIEAGWEAAKVAVWMRDYLKRKDLTRPAQF